MGSLLARIRDISEWIGATQPAKRFLVV